MNEEYYLKILGLNKIPDISELKKVYRQLSLKYHPDKIQDDKFFLLVKEAYEYFLNKHNPKKSNINNYIDILSKIENIIISCLDDVKITKVENYKIENIDTDDIIIEITDRIIKDSKDELYRVIHKRIHITNIIKEYQKHYKKKFKLFMLLEQRILNCDIMIDNIKDKIKGYIKFKKYVISCRSKKEIVDTGDKDSGKNKRRTTKI